MPAFGDELVQQDKHPAKTEQRQVSAQPFRERPVAAVQLQRRLPEAPVLARRQRWQWLSPEQRERLSVKNVADARNLIHLAPGADSPGDDWLKALLSKQLGSASCLQRGSDCVLLTPDLNSDGKRERLLCDLGGMPGGVICQLSAQNDQGKWMEAGMFNFYGANLQVVRQALRSGSLKISKQQWPDLDVGGSTARIVPVNCNSACAF